MDSLFHNLALLTQLLGHPVSAQALGAQTLRNSEGRPDLVSLGEVLRSLGYDNKVGARPLAEIPSLAAPLLLITKDGAGVVVESIDGRGDLRQFTVRR
ncbi:MAG TPA: type I secretion system permease/ATPase, partial [Ottowia sp.]|nr:type I secretion system permease/ATPase [Ottowia sp.]